MSTGAGEVQCLMALSVRNWNRSVVGLIDRFRRAMNEKITAMADQHLYLTVRPAK